MQLSVVTTLYRCAPFVEPFHDRCAAAARAITDDFEIILVHDGSPDDDLDRALALVARHAHVRVIDLARNFGHHPAMLAGLARARGNLVFLLDADLQEPPELLASFWREMTASGADLVHGVSPRRRERLPARLAAGAFYRLFALLAAHPIPAGSTTARLMSRRFVRALLRHRDADPVLFGLCAMTGFHQVALEVDKGPRASTTYDLRRRVALLAAAITSFSERPLALVPLAGAGMLGVGLALTLTATGPLLVSVWLAGGITTTAMGVVALYLARLLREVRRRPRAIVRAVHDGRERRG